MAFEHINIRKILGVALSNNAIIVDVRSNEDFLNGHIPMAINVPFDAIEGRRVRLPKGNMLIVYCENGITSMRAARILDELGYEVVNCVGGMKNYNGSLTK